MKLPTEAKITSHRPIIGWVIVVYKKIIKMLISPYLRTVFENEHQAMDERFNNVHQAMDERFNNVHQAMDERFNNVYERINITTKDILNRTDSLFVTLKQRYEELYKVLNQITERFEILENYLKDKVEEIEEIKEKIGYQNIKSFNYLSFNERFGGDPEYVKSLHQQFIPFFVGRKNILDIGTGRGLFLELLKNEGIDAYGIEADDDYLSLYKEKGLNGQKGDGIFHLKGLKDNSLGGIFISHVVEHLMPAEISTLIGLCYQKLTEGSYLIIITPNISNLGILSHTFYKDLTHIKPLHPETLKFLLESKQFKEIDERYFSSLPDAMKLRLVGQIKENAGGVDEIVRTVNENFSSLNNFLYGDLDYAIIGRK